MSGICGFIANRECDIDNSVLTQMCSSLYGDVGLLTQSHDIVLDDKSFGLAAKGTTFHFYHDSEFCVALDGHIYNRDKLTSELGMQDSLHGSVTDESLVLSAYRKWGADCAEHMNGKFVFAIYDISNKKLLLAKDHFGKVPLFYYQNEKCIVFATDLKSLMKFPYIPHIVDKSVLGFFLRLGYIPTPFSIYENVCKLPSGSIMVYEAGDATVKSYWRPNEAYHNVGMFSGSYQDAQNQLEKLLLDAVRIRIQDETSIGALLSSGIDSSLMAAMVQKESGGNLTTFTIGMDDKRYNEAELAKAIADRLGTRHHEYTISEQDLLHCVDELPALLDEPFGDSGLIPMMVVSKLSGKDMDAVFTGDGGDEVFEGYLHYGFVRQAQKYEPIGKVLHAVLPASLRAKLPHSVKHVVENRNPETQTQLLIPDEVALLNSILVSPFMAPYYGREASMNISNWEARRQVLDMETSFVDDAIEKSGLAAKFAALDLRSPLIDYRVAEFSLSLPNIFKSQGSVTKRILRDLAYKYVSKELLDLPKRGFCIPIDSWMNSVLRERIEDYSSDAYLTKQGLFNPKALREAITQNYSLKWNFFVLQQWYQENVK